MAFILKDRVKENTTSTGTGDISLGGASSTFDTFQSYMSNGDTTYYAIAHTETGIDEWEVGLGTWNTGNTLSRTTVIAGSNGTSAVNFSSGNKDIFMTLPASKVVPLDINGNIDINAGTIDGTTIGATTASTGKFTTLETTSNADIGGYLDLEVLSGHATYQEGRVWYDSLHKTLNFYSDVNNVVHELGIEEHQRVYNNTGSTISKGAPLYFSGNYTAGTIDVPTVGLADATDVNAYNAQGLAAADIADGSYGYCIIAGQLTGLDTSGLTAGTNFFVGLTPGAVQNASPTYPNYPMCLGWVVNSDATEGILLVNQQNHSVNSFRVRTDAHIGGDFQVDGDLTVLGTTTSVSTSDVTAGAPFYRANEGDSIGEAGTTFSGSGLDDAFFSGHFTGTTPTTYYVKIDGTGTPDTFSVSTDNFATTISTGNAITGSPQLIHSADNIYVEFGATTGHTLNDVWTGTASPINVDTGFFSNRNTGATGVGYTHVGLFFDVSDSKWKVVEEYDPTPSGAIDTGHASFSTGTLVASTFEGNLNGDVTGDVSGNASSADTLSTARTIGGVSFDGSANIDLPGVNTTGNQNTTGSAATLTTARTIQLSGDVTGSASFDGSADITITAAVQDDSHTHVISNVDGLQTALDAKADDSTTITAGSGLTGGGNLGADRTINVGAGSGISVTADAVAHADTSTQASVNNSNGTVIQDVTLDGFGHVTALGSVDLDGRYVNVTGDTMTGALTLQRTLGDITHLTLKQQNTSGDISSQKAFIDFTFVDANTNGTPQVRIGANVGEDGGDANTQALEGSGEFVVYTATGTSDTANSLTEKFRVSHDGKLFAGSNRVFADNYHPNADKWTTARTLSLTGEASGSVSWDGSANASLSVTLSNTALDDQYVDVTGDTMTGRLYIDSTSNDKLILRGSDDPSIELQNSSDAFRGRLGVSNTGKEVRVVGQDPDNTNNIHILGIGQNGLRYSTNNGSAWYKVWHANNDGSGSGLDADTLDGSHASSFALASHSHSNYITSNANDTGTGSYSTTGTYWEVKGDGGGIAMTTNDGYGNANLTFNHRSGVPDKNGAALRIETNVDSAAEGVFTFEASSGAVTGGTAVSLPVAMSLAHDYMEIPDTIRHAGDTDTYMQFHGANSWRVVTGGTERLEATNSGIRIDNAFTLPTTDGTANQVLVTNGSGTVSWATQTDTNTNQLTTFQLEDGDGTEVTISHGKEVKFVEGGGIDINWTDTSTGSDGDPYDLTFTADSNKYGLARLLGWEHTYGSSNYNDVYYDEAEDAVALFSSTDTSIGMAFRAVAVTAGQKVKFTINVKSSAADADGLYVRLYYYTGDLPDGKTHVSNSSTGGSGFVQEDTAGDSGWYENGAHTTSWRTFERTWTAPTTGYVSLVLLNWSGFSGTLYAKQPDIETQSTATADKWTTARTLSLTGDVTGSVSIDGSADASITTTVGDDSHSHTNYITSNANDNVSGHTEWQDNYEIRLGNGADFRMYHNSSNSHTYFRNYNHAAGNIYFQGEDAEGTNHALLYMYTANSAPYVSLFQNGSERLRTESAGVSVDGLYVGGNGSNPHNANGIQVNMATDEKIVLSGSSNPYIRWQEGTADKAYIQWNASNDALSFHNQQAQYYDFHSNSNTGVLSIRLKGLDGDVWGYVYANDGQEIGFLDEGASWAYRIVNDSNHEWRIANTVEMTLTTTSLDLKNNTITNVEDIYLNDVIYHNGDTNTYMQFHAADQWRVVTGGSERLEVNNSLITSTLTIQAPRFQENSTYYADFGNTGDSIRVAGDIVAYYSSDKRLKTNIKPIENALDKVTKLGGYTFNWSEEAEDKDTEKTEVGVIAQEVQEVMPELVHEKDNGYLAVDYPKMVALLVESIKELKEEINELKRGS